LCRAAARSRNEAVHGIVPHGEAVRGIVPHGEAVRDSRAAW
jgi:hypothetical protein